MATDKKNEIGIPEIIPNNALPTIFIDNLIASTRSDGLNYIRFTVGLPEGMKEEARMMIPADNLKRMLDVLCKQCDYFPVKQVPKGKKDKLKSSQHASGSPLPDPSLP